MVDLSHYDAISARLNRERQRLAAAKTERERVFRAVQVSQAEKEIAAELKFLGIEETPPPDMTDDELMKALFE